MILIKFITFLWIFAIVSARKQFSVGVIFDAAGGDLEIAFRSAIDRVNVHERSFELIPIVEYGATDDSFIIEKIVCKLMSENVIAIFGPNTGSTSGIVSAICDTFEIPHILFDWKPLESHEERQFASLSLSVYPDNLMLARGIADVVQELSWRSFTIIYETEKELMQMQDVLQINEPTDYPTPVRQLSDGPDHRPFLKDIKMSGERTLILACSNENILHILRQAAELKMLGEYESIFIPSLDTHTLDFQELLNVEANITTIRIMDPSELDVKNAVNDWFEREKRQGHYFKLGSDKIRTNMILINDAVWVFAKGLTEFGVNEIENPHVNCNYNHTWTFGKPIMEFVKARSVEAATGRADFNEYGQRTFFTIRILEKSNTGFVDVSVWDPVNGVVDIGGDTDLKSQRVDEKIANKTFIVTSRIGAPFLLNREQKEGETLEGNNRYEGYSMDLIDSIAKLLGFKYRFELAPDGKYGSYNKDTKQWDGLVKQLLDGNADLGICDLTMTSSRRKAVDFTPPFMTLGVSILFLKPESRAQNLFSFLSPFSVEVWTYTATAFLGVSFLLFALARMAPDDWENPHPCKEPEEVENIWTVTNTTWLTMGSLMGQGCDILPKAASTRLATGMWWFFALMMLNSYTANLAAFLTSSRMEGSIGSAEDLAAQSKIKYGAVLGGSTMGFFRDSNFSIYQKMWAAMESARPSVFTKSNDEGVDRVQKGKRLYAFFMESTSLEYIVERNCDLQQVGGWLDYKTYGIAMPFNSPYRKQISEAVLKLGESGQLAELKRKWWKEKHGGGRCSQATASSEDTPELGIDNVGGVFLVLGIGLVSAIILGILEFLWNIKSVALEEKISLYEAFKLEATFVLKFWITTKPVRGNSGSSGSSSSSSKESIKSIGASTTRSTKTNGSINGTSGSVGAKLKKIGSMFSLKSKGDRDSKSSKVGKAVDIDKYNFA